MLYIAENIFAYLNTKEVVALREKGTGSFLGRRFYPPGEIKLHMLAFTLIY